MISRRGRCVRTLERKGFFQQLTWSPDGQWLSGVANSFGTGWSVARMNAVTGEVNAVSRVDCCTPDWFPDSRQMIFSNRPPGQKGNDGHGWTQLWMADAEGKARRLVYGEDGRHVYGGNVSPDGKYVLFTGNMREDGDPGNAGAPMGSDAAGGCPDHRRGEQGAAGVTSGGPQRSGARLCRPAGSRAGRLLRSRSRDAADARKSSRRPAGKLAAEVRDKGWIVFSAANESGDWDLFLMRPDGSDRRRLTDTRQYNEAGAKFSPDGKKLLYYRMADTDEGGQQHATGPTT